jgi:hypothetical protein
LSRHEGRHSPRLSAITLIQIGRMNMLTSNIQVRRTSTDLRKHEARWMFEDGFDIAHIETLHRPDGDESTIVWTRPYLPGEIRDEELPY